MSIFEPVPYVLHIFGLLPSIHSSLEKSTGSTLVGSFLDIHFLFVRTLMSETF